MQSNLKPLRAILHKAICCIDDQRCDNIPPHIIKSTTKILSTAIDDMTGEQLVPIDEVCQELGFGMTKLRNEISAGKLPKPLPLTETRVGIRRKDVDAYKSFLSL